MSSWKGSGSTGSERTLTLGHGRRPGRELEQEVAHDTPDPSTDLPIHGVKGVDIWSQPTCTNTTSDSQLYFS